MDTILIQMHPVLTSSHYFPKIGSNVTLPLTPTSSEWSLSFRFSDLNFVCIFHFVHVCYMPYPWHSPWFDRSQVYLVKRTSYEALHLQSSPASHHFLPLRSKYESTDKIYITLYGENGNEQIMRYVYMLNNVCLKYRCHETTTKVK